MLINLDIGWFLAVSIIEIIRVTHQEDCKSENFFLVRNSAVFHFSTRLNDGSLGCWHMPSTVL